jgi:hypothetical protein
MKNEHITIKLATAADSGRIAELAALDTRSAPQGDVLLAEVDGRLLAAVAMDGTAVADPFQRTAGVVSLLREQIAGPRERPRRRGRRLGRLLPTG